MPNVTLKWLHAPGHARSMGPRVIARAVKSHAVVIDWSEMYFNLDDLKLHAKDYQHFIGEPKRKDSRGRVVNHDVVLSIRKDVKILEKGEFFVSGEVKQVIKYMPERHGKWVLIQHEGERILVIAWHPHPNPFRRVKLVLPRYRRSVERVERLQKNLIAIYKPDLVLNGGDLQLGPGKTKVHPNKLAERLGMKTNHHKIDWQMWVGKNWRVGADWTINAAKINKGVDHLWMVLVLNKPTRLKSFN